MKCLIIEDEAPARRILRRYIAEVPSLELVGTAPDAIAGLELLARTEVDLLFLDVNLPKLSGVDLLRTLRRPPAVVLTTAYSEFAVEGYALDVADYLLKPFDFTRFLAAVQRARTRTAPARRATPTPGPAAAPPTDHFFVNVDRVVHRVELARLVYLRAEGDFVRLVLTEGQLLVSRPLAYFAELLAGAGVIQVHRSYLLRLGALQRLEGNEVVTARGRVPVGRKYREELRRRLTG